MIIALQLLRKDKKKKTFIFQSEAYCIQTINAYTHSNVYNTQVTKQLMDFLIGRYITQAEQYQHTDKFEESSTNTNTRCH